MSLKDGNWIALDKALALSFSKIRREYSEIEAMFSLSLDINCGKERSEAAYSRMWSWSRGKVKRFIDAVKENGQATDRQRTGSRHAYRLLYIEIQDATDRQRTGNGQATDTKYKEQEQEQEKEVKDYAQSPIMEIPLNIKNTVFSIFDEDFKQWQETFPNVDILSELRKCKQWSMDNQTRRKTKGGIRKHISSWLSKAQDKPSRINQINGGKDGADRRKETSRQCAADLLRKEIDKANKSGAGNGRDKGVEREVQPEEGNGRTNNAIENVSGRPPLRRYI